MCKANDFEYFHFTSSIYNAGINNASIDVCSYFQSKIKSSD